MSSSKKRSPPLERVKNMMMILDVNPTKSRFSCLLTSCPHKSTTVGTVLNHFWKFNGHNGPTKKCSGQNSSSLHVYPVLFDPVHSHRTIEILSKEYGHIDWAFVSRCVSKEPPDLCSLIRTHDFMVTGEFAQRYSDIQIPDSLRGYVHPHTLSIYITLIGIRCDDQVHFGFGQKDQ